MQAIVTLILAVLSIQIASPALSQDATADPLYRARLFVTGQREATRLPAIREGFGIVLVKLSGDASIVGDDRYAAIEANAPALVRDFKYRDLLAYRPIHDEQGTYDRPYELTITFDHAAIDQALRTLGHTPWLAPRPRLRVVLAVENFNAHYVLSADGNIDRSADLREAIASASDRVGLAVAFPAQAELNTQRIATDAIPSPDVLRALAPEGDAILAGRIAFSEDALAWVEHWRLDYHGSHAVWMAQHETFDEAFRAAMRETLQQLAMR